MATLEEAITSTLFDQSDAIADSVTHHSPVLTALEEEGNIRRTDGGDEFRKVVLYNDTEQGDWYSGYGSFNLDSIEELTAFKFRVKQCYEPLAISGREKRANRGEERLLDVVEEKMKGTIARLRNRVSASLRSDGTGSGGLELDGLKKAISTSPSSGTYGGIDRSANTWARNLAVNTVLTAANIQEAITDAMSQITRGSEMPTLGICDRIAWKFLHSSLTAIQRISSPLKKASGGFRGIEYDGATFVFDGGFGSAELESNSVRLINPKYFTFDMVRGADFKPLSDQMVRPADQDAYFSVILLEGNLCCSAPALQAVIYT